jgi:hypothetical protein
MPAPITEVDTFTSTVSVPVAGDARTATSLLTAFQALANRTRNLLNRMIAAEAAVAAMDPAVAALSQYAQFQYAFGSVITGTPTLQTMLFQVGGYSVTGNLIQVPAAGWYRLSTFGVFNTNSTNDGPTIGVLVRVAGVTLRTMTTVRPGTVTGDPTPEIQAAVVFQITDPGTQTIELRAQSPGGSTLSSTGRTEIQRLVNP